MRSDKFKAYKLRMQGRSYTEISNLLFVPKSTLSNWFSELIIPEGARERINKRVYAKSTAALIERNKSQTYQAEKRASGTRSLASSQVGSLSDRDLFIVGIALYWAEGHKRPIIARGKIRTYHPVSFTNSDPKLISLFMRFLRETCQVPEEKIKAHLRIFDHQNEVYILDFWQKTAKIPMSNFGKVYRGISISSQHKRPYNILPYGTLQIRVNDTSLFHKIMGWIDGLQR